MKIKSRKEREKEYRTQYDNVSNDKFTRLQEELGNKFNEDLLDKAFKRIEVVNKKIKYYTIHFTFYEKPIQSHRPRTKGGKFKGMYVPNAKSNHDAIREFVNKLKEDILIISTPMRITLKAYYPMPKDIKPIEMVLFETEHDYAIGKPDFDNVLKAYSDMLLKNIILDDDLISSCKFDKYYSLKPRVELYITYTNGCTSQYTYKRIKNRKTFKDLQNHIETELLLDK